MLEQANHPTSERSVPNLLSPKKTGLLCLYDMTKPTLNHPDSITSYLFKVETQTFACFMTLGTFERFSVIILLFQSSYILIFLLDCIRVLPLSVLL